MRDRKANCVLLADRHMGLAEGVRGLLETLFGTVVMVADARSLQESARRLQPDVTVVDLSLTGGSNLDWLPALHRSCHNTNVVVISVHDELAVQAAAKAAGADGYVLKRDIATDLLPTIEALLAGGHGGQSEDNEFDPIHES
jgi:DNA-binding NarL/FixJ family response regulator